MPISRGGVGFARFALVGDIPKDVRRWVTKALKSKQFEPIDLKGDEERAAGFVEIEDNERTDFSPGAVFLADRALAAWKVERIRVPGAVLRAQMLEWGKEFEGREGRPPGRKEKTEMKEQLRRTLRGKQDPTRKAFDVCIDFKAAEAHIWASTRSVIEEVHEVLEATLAVRLVPRVPASFVRAEVLDTLEPTAELLGEVARG